MYLGTLIKKDIRHQSRFILAAAIFLILPHIIALIALITNQMGEFPQDNWIDYFQAASIVDVILCVVLIPFFSGNAIAGERADRSAEFLAYLPIERKTTILSKAVVAMGISIVFFGVCSLVFYAFFQLLVVYHPGAHIRAPQGAWISIILGSCVFMFGIAWLVSTFAQSATFAAAAGVIIPLAVGIMLMLIYPTETNEHRNMTWLAYVIISFVIGPLCFIAGVIYYSKRVEP